MYILSMKILPTDEQVFGWLARKIPTPPDRAINAIYILVGVVVVFGGIAATIYDIMEGNTALVPSAGSVFIRDFFQIVWKMLGKILL